jgi:hypothetical protein
VKQALLIPLGVLLVLGVGAPRALAQGTAFTYQGILRDKNTRAPVAGAHTLAFSIWSANSGGAALFQDPAPRQRSIPPDGVVTETLDAGTGTFTGERRWLQIDVDGVPQLPRIELTPVPYAVLAENVANGTISWSQLSTPGSTPQSGQVLGYNGSSLIWMNEATASGAWGLYGNAGTIAGTQFIGTTDGQPLELRVNNGRALRLEQVSATGTRFSVNSIGGYKITQVVNGALGGTIAGGGFTDALILNGDHPNTVSADFGSIGGGSGNYVAGPYGVVPGGIGNYAFGFGSFAAGQNAEALDDHTFVWGDGSQTTAFSGTNRFEILASGGMTLTSPRGIALDPFNGPVITRGWDCFATADPNDRKCGLGLWGLFMESASLGLGMPDNDVGERSLSFWKYSLNGTYTPLFSIRNTDRLASFSGAVNVTGQLGAGSVLSAGSGFGPMVHGITGASATDNQIPVAVGGGAPHGIGVDGDSQDYIGVWGYTGNASGKGAGVLGQASGVHGPAGNFMGDVNVTGNISKGGGSFKIDHPLDPANKYLSHSFVESPDMMNIYNGNVTLGPGGEAWVELPAYFEALNNDFRYQLTCVGAFAPVYVAEKIHDHRFKIAGAMESLEVSWMVTGIPHDPYANASRILVETEKPADERGKFLHPSAPGEPESKGIWYEQTRKFTHVHPVPCTKMRRNMQSHCSSLETLWCHQTQTDAGVVTFLRIPV